MSSTSRELRRGHLNGDHPLHASDVTLAQFVARRRLSAVPRVRVCSCCWMSDYKALKALAASSVSSAVSEAARLVKDNENKVKQDRAKVSTFKLSQSVDGTRRCLLAVERGSRPSWSTSSVELELTVLARPPPSASRTFRLSNVRGRSLKRIASSRLVAKSRISWPRSARRRTAFRGNRTRRSVTNSPLARPVERHQTRPAPLQDRLTETDAFCASCSARCFEADVRQGAVRSQAQDAHLVLFLLQAEGVVLLRRHVVQGLAHSRGAPSDQV